MKFQISEIEVNGNDAVLTLRGKVPKNVDYLDWYCSMLGRVLCREKVEVKSVLTDQGKQIAVRKRAVRKKMAAMKCASHKCRYRTNNLC
jgi:hypothetical protein